MRFKKCIIYFIVFVMFLNCEYLVVSANNNHEISSVVISTNINKVQFKKQFNGTVIVYFNDLNLYNNNVKLSYHIYDQNDQNIQFENERLSLTLVDGKATTNVSIDLDKIDTVKDLKKCIIKFDLVDEQNVYWFYNNPSISFDSINIQYIDSFLYRMQGKYGYIIQEQQIQLIFSIVFIFIAFFIYRYMKKVNKKNLSK